MVGVILFRAQPFHLGHLSQIKRAFKDIRELDTHLFIIVGSADKAGKRNPLPIELRIDLIKSVIQEEFSYKERQYIHIVPLRDLSDESNNTYEWGRYLYNKLCAITQDSSFIFYYSDKPDIILSWFDSDLLNHIYFKFLPRYNNISATLVRQHILNFKGEDLKVLQTLLPTYVYSKIEELRDYIIDAERGVNE